MVAIQSLNTIQNQLEIDVVYIFVIIEKEFRRSIKSTNKGEVVIGKCIHNK